MKFGFVFTNYNNSIYSLQAIQSLTLGNHWQDCRVIIVDNASRDAERAQLEEISKAYSQVQIIYNKENLGYFPGLNVGIDFLKGLPEGMDFWVIGNNDLNFPPDFCEQLINHKAIFATCPVVAPDIVTLDGQHQNPHVAHELTHMRQFLWKLYYSNYYLALGMRRIASLTCKVTERKDYQLHDQPGFVEQGYGACYILGPLFMETFGRLWAPTFLMHEEYFLSRQLEAKNYRVYYLPEIVISHHCHASVGSLPSRRIWELSRDAYRIMAQQPCPPL